MSGSSCLSAGPKIRGAESRYLDRRNAPTHRQSALRDLHFAKLPEAYKGAVTEVLAQKPVKGFVICSNKKNMRRYRNVRAERMGVNDWFYCWITRVALVRARISCGAGQFRNTALQSG